MKLCEETQRNIYDIQYYTSTSVVSSLPITWVSESTGGFPVRCTYSLKLTLRALLKCSISRSPQAAPPGNESRHWPPCPHPNLLVRLNRSRCTPLTPPPPPPPPPSAPISIPRMNNTWRPRYLFLCVHVGSRRPSSHTHENTHTVDAGKQPASLASEAWPCASLAHTHTHTHTRALTSTVRQ